MADNLYSNQAYQNLSNQVNTAQLWASQGVTDDYLQKLAAGTTFETGNAEVGYKWKVVPTAKGNTVELMDYWTKTPVTQTQSLSYVQTPDPKKQQTYVYDMNEVARIVDAYSKGGATNYQVVYISPDGDPYKRRVYDITPSGGTYAGPTNVTGPTAGTAVTPESLINSVTQQPTQFTPITPVTPKVTGTTTQSGTPATVTYPTPINQQTTKDATTGAETATTAPVNTTTPTTVTTPSTTTNTTSTWGNMDTTPVNTINAADITWRTLPSELFTFPFWREGMSRSTTTAGSTPGYTMQQPTYSPELFFPAAQQWGRWTPSEQQAYQSAVQGTGASWDDVFASLKKKWGVFSDTVKPNWTPVGWNR